MGRAQEKDIRAYQLKDKTFVCPVCATDEERQNITGQGSIIAEDEIHDNNLMFCIRCKKKIE